MINLVAGPDEEIRTSENTVRPPSANQVIASVFPIVRFNGTPTPEISLTIVPFPSWKVYKACNPSVVRLVLPPGVDVGVGGGVSVGAGVGVFAGMDVGVFVGVAVLANSM